MARSTVLPLLALALVLAPTAARAETLEDALIQVYHANPRLEAARARLRTVDETVPQALAGWRPTVTASTTAAFGQVENGHGSGDVRSVRQGLTIEQPLYEGGRTTAEIDRAEHAVLAERARLLATEQEVLLRAAEAYTAVVRERAVLDLARTNEARLRKQLLAARDRFRFGELTNTDVAQAESRVARAMADRVRAEGDLAVAAADYRRVVGQDPDEPVPAGKPRDLPASEADALAASDAHPALAAARFDLEGAHDEITRTLAALKPRLALSGQAGYGEDPGTLAGRESEVVVAATLKVPLYQGGAEHARVRQSKQAVRQRGFELDDVRRAVARDASAAWQALTATAARIRSLERQIRAAELALDGVRQEALVGARTLLDVLDAEQELFEARVALVQALRDETLAAYGLRAAVGTLTAERLGLPVERYDPQAYYTEVRGKWFGLGEPLPESRDRR